MRTASDHFLRCSLILILLTTSCCFWRGSVSGQFDTPATYFSTMEELVVEVAYEQSAEPFTEPIFRNRGTYYPWDFTQENLEALFDGRSKSVSITVPRLLGEMTAVPNQNQEQYSLEDIMDLAQDYRNGVSTATECCLFVIFLDGYLEVDGSPDESVIGISVSGTPITAMFKPVIESTGLNEEGAVPRYVEQSTIIHELGHAIGLVDNGVPLSSAHNDSENGAHCEYSDCVMYWLNEQAKDLKDFVRGFILRGDQVMFCDDCLADTRSYLA